MRRHGFTLIELLVVIAIIAILAAILFPVFAQARENARKATCLSNCKQMGQGLTMYLQDYDETFPGHAWSAGRGSWPMPDGSTYIGHTMWTLVVYPYVKNQQVFVCPSDDDPKRDTASNPGNGGYLKPFPASYGCNADIVCRQYSPWWLSAAQIQFPAETYFIGDQAYHFSGFTKADAGPYARTGINRLRFSKYDTGGGNLVNSGGHIALTPTGDAAKVTRHSMGSIIVFCDGHAKWERYNSIKGTKADPLRATP